MSNDRNNIDKAWVVVASTMSRNLAKELCMMIEGQGLYEGLKFMPPEIKDAWRQAAHLLNKIAVKIEG